MSGVVYGDIGYICIAFDCVALSKYVKDMSMTLLLMVWLFLYRSSENDLISALSAGECLIEYAPTILYMT